MGRFTFLVLCGLILSAVSFNGAFVSGDDSNVGPSEAQCRPYIEKAINELKTGEPSDGIEAGDIPSGETISAEVSTNNEPDQQDDNAIDSGEMQSDQPVGDEKETVEITDAESAEEEEEKSIDTDGDGIRNEDDTDIDGDNKPNEQDEDMDGDGILNEEDDDIDGDVIPNERDPDIDGDGVLNVDDRDIDGDGVPNVIDHDLDGDGVPNIVDKDIDGDGVSNANDNDLDGDGIPNEEDDDIDGDGIPNDQDNDIDGDGIPNDQDDDIDGDGIPNSQDDDIDGDGILNEQDNDIDGDGIPNDQDDDIDGDGIPNEKDNDIDGDGIPNDEDDDIDGDGIPNDEDADLDGDGIPNKDDDDIDGDGVSNEDDADIDGDGVPNESDEDIDGDGIKNEQDDDIDGDGVANEQDNDIDGDGEPNEADKDIDGDGVLNHDDVDIDGDGIPNERDHDVDGDGMPNEEEPKSLDIDGDGIPNDDDSDIDGDLKPNEVDDDMDGDGIPNVHDRDVDGDGVPNIHDEDSLEAEEVASRQKRDVGAEPVSVEAGEEQEEPSQEKPGDIDGDGIPDHEDDDKDGDGVPDHKDDDIDGDGIPNEQDADRDGDGIPNEHDDDDGEEHDEKDDDSKPEDDTKPEDELLWEGEIPAQLRSRDHITELLQLNTEFNAREKAVDNVAEIILRDIKRIYESAIKPLETLYKYRDLSNRHFSDPEIFSKPLVLFMGPWSGGKSTIINYLTGNEYTPHSLRSGAEPSPAYFNILTWGNETEVLDGTQLAADYTFSGLQKFGEGLEERLRGLKMPNKLLEKVNIVEIPGILEVRKQVSRLFPFNDACQWFIDRADIIFLVYDPAKLDVGPETEAILDQLKGREYQTRIILNKADTIKPEELLRVQSALIWNISPLMSSAQPPLVYTTSLWSHPYQEGAPARLLLAQERAFLRDLRTAVDKRIEHKIASARRFAVRVRNHAKMVDCYLNTYYNHKTLFGNKKRIADEIINHPQNYHIYEGLSTLTNISRYDLPDPEVYRDFFRLNPLYEFKKLSETCTYFRGCPITKLDVAIAYDLPELAGKYKKMTESALANIEAKGAADDEPETKGSGKSTKS
uniref:Sarcalumenin n=2 Tax=Bactrocera latifrons TaxID=174628 RepID=A0A0K8VJG5_BACLA